MPPPDRLLGGGLACVAGSRSCAHSSHRGGSELAHLSSGGAGVDWRAGENDGAELLSRGVAGIAGEPDVAEAAEGEQRLPALARRIARQDIVVGLVLVEPGDV